MKLNFLAFAIPFFLLLIALEFLVAKKKQISYSSFHDTMKNLSVGIGERLMDLFVTGLFFYIYDNIQKRFGIFRITPSVPLWIMLLICTDFLWYWYHRLAHEINIFWAVHVVHHQSEDFNYSVSARITVFQAFVRTGFWTILPLIGFPAGMITSMLLVHGLYPFFIHTKTIGKLGILEYFLVTPSHHRVHHACNPEYLDKNYGDVFIIWDKLFGTFEKEGEQEISYGLTKPLKSHSFLWQHFHFPIELFFAARTQSGLKNKVKLFLGSPEYIKPRFRQEAEKAFHICPKDDRQMERPLNRYVIWQMSAMIGTLFFFILFERNIPPVHQLVVSVLILVTLINCGAIMEQKTWIVYLEYSRLALAGLSVVLLLPSHWIAFLILLLLMALIAQYSTHIRSRYLRLVYATG